MGEELIRVLKMIESGVITSEEGQKLIQAMQKSEQKVARVNSHPIGRFLRLDILSTEEGEKEVDEMEELARIAKQNRKEKTAADVKEYTSKFESMADASNKQEEPQISKPKKEKVEEEKKPVEVKKFNYEDMKPIYSEEELAEIEEQEYEDENAWDDDVDYEEYDEYYDD